MNIMLIISYEGTHFFGWQEVSSGPNIEGTLKKILEQIYQETIVLQAASRTDRGVHAERQVINFHTTKQKNLEKLKVSLNKLLPSSIRILEIKQAKENFHPTLDVWGKEYHYMVTTSPIQSPFERNFAWHYYGPFNLEKMKKAANYFLGTHDFNVFCNTHENKSKNTTRTLYRLDIFEEPNLLRFEVEGNHFLYKMVCNLVGTLVYIGKGKISLEKAKNLISKKNRIFAGITAPAHGLFLKNIQYSKDTLETNLHFNPV